MKVSLFVLLCAFAAGCGIDAFEEIAAGQTATVYACSEWSPNNLGKIQDAINDWNQAAGPRFGRDLYAYGGYLPNAIFNDDSSGDGMHCIYRLTPENLTDAGRDAWRRYHVNEDASATDLGEDIVVFSTLPPEWIDQWTLQPTIAHELGHAAGLGHTPADAGYESIMKSKKHGWYVQAVDVDRFCQEVSCSQ